MLNTIMPWILVGIIWTVALIFITKLVCMLIKNSKSIGSTPRLPDLDEPPKKMNTRQEMEKA